MGIACGATRFFRTCWRRVPFPVRATKPDRKTGESSPEKDLRDREHPSKIHTRMYDVKRSDPLTVCSLHLEPA